MYASVTRYKMKDGSRDAAVALMEQLKGQTMGLSGMSRFVNVGNEDGSGYIISVVDSKATFESHGRAENVKKIWANFADLLEAEPAAEGFDVLADWHN